jgi:hypothetical protein
LTGNPKREKSAATDCFGASMTSANNKIRTVEGILRRWDPVGVQPGRFAPADEYDRYAPQIVSMIESGCTADALTAHLEHLSVHTFDVGSNMRSSAKFAAEIVRTLQSPGA